MAPSIELKLDIPRILMQFSTVCRVYIKLDLCRQRERECEREGERGWKIVSVSVAISVFNQGLNRKINELMPDTLVNWHLAILLFTPLSNAAYHAVHQRSKASVFLVCSIP